MFQRSWFIIALAALLFAPMTVAAQENVDTSGGPVQLSVFNPVQIIPDTQSVAGLRLSIFHSKNHNVTGFDWVWLGFHETTGDFVGVAFMGIGASLVRGEMTGWQSTLGNFAMGGMTGLQLGVLNWTSGHSVGMQWGAVNIAEDFTGFQLGIVNYTKRMKGLQIGLVNIITEGPLPFMVIANANF